MKKNFSEMLVKERKDYLIEHFMYEVEMLFFALQQHVIFSQKISKGDNSFFN